MSAKAHDGRTVTTLNLIDEHTRESLFVRPELRWSSAGVIEALADVMLLTVVPVLIRSDHGPENLARYLHKWAGDIRVQTRFASRPEKALVRTDSASASTPTLSGRVPPWRDLLLAEGRLQVQARTLAGSLQHHPATLFARLPLGIARDVATATATTAYDPQIATTQYAYPLPPQPVDGGDDMMQQGTHCATLTIQLVHKDRARHDEAAAAVPPRRQRCTIAA